MLSIGPCRLRFLVIGQEPSCPLLFLTLHGINEVVTVDPESGEGQKVRRSRISINYMTKSCHGAEILFFTHRRGKRLVHNRIRAAVGH